MSEPPVAVIVAMHHEARPLVHRFGLTLTPGYEGPGVQYEGRAGEAELVLLVTGVGPNRAADAADALLENREVAHVVIAGLCGALNPLLRVGELVWPDVLIDGTTHRFHYRSMDHHRTGHHISVANLVATPEDKAAMYHRHQAESVDMESAPIAAMCDDRDVAWICVRAVGDTADQPLPEFVNELTDESGYSRPWHAARRLARSPAKLLSLARLARRSTRAADALARGLGQWFDSETHADEVHADTATADPPSPETDSPATEARPD